MLNTIRSEINLDHLPQDFAKDLRELLFRNWDVFSKDRHDLGRTKSYQHDVQLTQDRILFRKQFRIPQEHVEYIQNHTQELLKLGAIKLSSSKHNAPIFCAPKPRLRVGILARRSSSKRNLVTKLNTCRQLGLSQRLVTQRIPSAVSIMPSLVSIMPSAMRVGSLHNLCYISPYVDEIDQTLFRFR